MNVTRPENKLLKACSSSFVYDRCVYDKACIGMPMSIQTPRDMEAAYTWHKWHQATHAPTHCLPSIQCQQTTLSHTHRHPTLAPSLTEAPWARQICPPAGRWSRCCSGTGAWARDEEAVSPHTLHQHMPAVSISMHMHVPHAHAPCTCTCAPCVCVCVGGWVLCVCVCVCRQGLMV